MTISMRLLLVVTTACAPTAWGQAPRRKPHIGYLYPAGGQQDSVFRITVGGQNLLGANKAYVSGQGVHAKVIQYYRPVRNIKQEQRRELLMRLKEVRDKRRAALSGRDGPLDPAGRV